jgi:hypothetical protein
LTSLRTRESLLKGVASEGVASEGVIPGGEHPPTPPVAVENIGERRSGWNRRPTQKFAKSQQQLADGIVSYFTAHESIDPKLYQEDLVLKEFEMNPMSFKATADPDTLYIHEAMRAPDVAQFKEAMKKEVPEHTRKGYGKVISRVEVPSHSKVLPAVWSMKCKRRIESREVYKHKARLNIGGHKQEYVVHYLETYSPVVRWTLSM